MNWTPWTAVFRAVGALIRHTILIGVFVALFYGIELEFHYFWGSNDPLLFNQVPFKWLFQSIDIVFAGVFGILAALEVVRIMRGEE